MKEFWKPVFKPDEPMSGPMTSSFPEKYLAKLPPRELIVDISYKEVPRKEIPGNLTEEQYLAIGVEREFAQVLESVEYKGAHYAPEMLARTRVSHELVQIISVSVEGKRGSKADPYRVMTKVRYPEGREEIMEGSSIIPLYEPNVLKEGELPMLLQGKEVKFPILSETQADFFMNPETSEEAKCFNSLGREATLDELYTIERGDYTFKIGDMVQFGDRLGYLAVIYRSEPVKVGIISRAVRGKGSRNYLLLTNFDAIDIPLKNENGSLKEGADGRLAKPPQEFYFKGV